MKRLVIATALAAFAIGGVAHAAAQAEEPEEAANSRKDSRAKAVDRFCIQQTGSRVSAARAARSKSEERDCVSAGGRVYTREDIDATGSPDLRDALRRLDPAIN